jgi:hypothetical protein
MFREIEPRLRNEGVLRHPDGSINFDAYREVAHRARRAAMVSSIEGTARFARATLLRFGRALRRSQSRNPLAENIT